MLGPGSVGWACATSANTPGFDRGRVRRTRGRPDGRIAVQFFSARLRLPARRGRTALCGSVARRPQGARKAIRRVELLVVVQAVAGSSPVAHPPKAAANADFLAWGRGLPGRGRATNELPIANDSARYGIGYASCRCSATCCLNDQTAKNPKRHQPRPTTTRNTSGRTQRCSS
jgi:hypothetical protein